MSFTSFLSGFGGSIGKMLGGGIISTASRFAGKLLGSYLEEKVEETVQEFRYKKQLEVLHQDSNTNGKIIPIVFGKAKVNGEMIWAQPLREHEFVDSGRTILRANKHVEKYTVSYQYSATFAVGICEGPIDSVDQIWAGGKQLRLHEYNYRIYKGTADQQPDAAILASQGGSAPAFRGLAYIVFYDFPLADFNNKIPSLSFEVTRKLASQDSESTYNLVESMIMIPGSGEYVYDTLEQTKTVIIDEQEVETIKLNVHNPDHIPDGLYSLNQLLETCPNVKSIGLVVCWFGDNMNITDCFVKPRVEHKDVVSRYREEWSVAGYTRDTAPMIGYEGLQPRYGGTVHDASLLRFLAELKRRNIHVMFYPMMFMDVAGKPWRGHLTGKAEDIEAFFTKEHGYNNFIMHYAQLTRGLIDAFVIGSELIGLTSVKTDDNRFPAVEQLIELAKSVKQAATSNTKITYAADWSEYHHTKGGWFNLDPLWASPDIDFVGIDTYVPLTELKTYILEEDIQKGWTSGLGFDYELDEQGKQSPITPDYAWKNFEHWWSNVHVNPDGSATPWTPKMKKICFTEFGYPAVDRSPNQPNVFFDPGCVDGGLPRFSSGVTDFTTQRLSVEYTIRYWKNKEMLDGMYLWCWDSRPFPAWPKYRIWHDSYLWEKGHWVNQKLVSVPLSSVIREICRKANLHEPLIETIALEQYINGIVFDKRLSAFEAIQLLRCCYFFDSFQAGHKLIFTKRGAMDIYKIEKSDLVPFDDAKHFNIEEARPEDSINQIRLSFLSQHKDYELDHVLVTTDSESDKKAYFLFLPIVLAESYAEQLALKVIQDARIENRAVHFRLPITYLWLSPCDVLEIKIDETVYTVRITDIRLQGLLLYVSAVTEEIAIYKDSLPAHSEMQAKGQKTIEEHYSYFQLPHFPWLSRTKHLHIAKLDKTAGALHVSINGRDYDPVPDLEDKFCQPGKLISCHNSDRANCYFIDKKSKFVIRSPRTLKTIPEADLSSRLNLALLGKEIISFRDALQVKENTYEISYLLRGLFGTEDFICSHTPTETFMLLDSVTSLEVDQKAIGGKVLFKVNNKVYDYLVDELLPPRPTIIETGLQERTLNVSWSAKHMYEFDWFSQYTAENVHFNIELEFSYADKMVSKNTKVMTTNFSCEVPEEQTDLQKIVVRVSTVINGQHGDHSEAIIRLAPEGGEEERKEA